MQSNMPLLFTLLALWLTLFTLPTQAHKRNLSHSSRHYQHSAQYPRAAVLQSENTNNPLNANSLPATKAQFATGYGRLPITFEPNVGQVDKRVRFLSHTGHGTLFLTDTEAVLTLPLTDPKANSPVTHARFDPKHRVGKDKTAPHKIAVVRMKLTGALKPVAISGLQKLPGIVNYFRGNDPRQWHRNIPTYRQAKFSGVYKGVDMVYYGALNGKLEYDFVVKPGADPKAIKLAFFGATGARVTTNGDLALQTAAGEVRWQRPVTYQIIGGHRETVACSYELKREGKQQNVGFRLARYDTSRPVVIDPLFIYDINLSGSSYSRSNGIAVDRNDNAYVTGYTDSGFPTTPDAFQTTYGGGSENAFVTKLSSDGSTLLYSTYLGGSVDDVGTGIAVDSNGDAYVTGYTGSSDFPTTPGAFQTTDSGVHTDGFVTKLSSDGSTLLYSTYLGASNYVECFAIAVDSDGSAYVTGGTDADDFPTTAGAFQTVNNAFATGGATAFVTKFSSDGSSLVYSTYFGGTYYGTGITVDGNGNAYVTGLASYGHPTTPGAFQTAGEGGVFVTKFSADGSSLVYSAFIRDGESYAITVDSSGNAYVTGQTSFPDYPVTPGAFQTTQTGSYNAFVTKLNADGSSLVYSTYLGGSNFDLGFDIAVDDNGIANVTGATSSVDFPVTPGSLPVVNYGSFVTKFTADGSSLLSSTFLGTGITSYGIALDGSGSAYVTGVYIDAFVAKLDLPPFSATLTLTPGTVTGGTTAFGLITISGSAPGGGYNVQLSSSQPLIAMVGKTQLIHAGATTAKFSITTVPVTVDTKVVITVSDRGTVRSQTLLVKAPVVAHLTVNPTTVEGGVQTSTATVKLTGNAPSGGTLVSLLSSQLSVARVPATVRVPEGNSSVTFVVSTSTVTSKKLALIAANTGTTVKIAALTVTP